MIWKYLLCAVIAYLLGSISTGMLVSKRSGHNLRTEGSHNTGASNALRVLGLKGGAAVFAGDVCKAAAAVLIGQALCGHNGGLVAGLFAVLGHNRPVFFGFQGGKGIACAVAVLLRTVFWQGSMTMLLVFFLLLLFTQPFWPAAIWAFALLALGVYRHRSNIERLRNGTENKIGQKVK